MANLQYIGARYVPKFYLNSDDNSNDWKSGELYEALTIVTYNNDSYTSKTTVPASVGNPADNPAYWACTTKYTAALVALQTTVADQGDEINSLQADSDLVSLDVMAYDGATYDAKLKNAIADVTSNPNIRGARVYLPSGEVRLSDINLPSGKCFEFIGQGMNTSDNSNFGTIIKPLYNTTTYIFGATASGRDFYTFKNITFHGESTCAYALHGDYFSGALIERCSFLDFTQIAVKTLGVCNITGCYFRNPGATNAVVHSDSYITNNEFSASNVSLEVQASGNRIIGNLINGGATYGLYINPVVLLDGEQKAVNNLYIAGNYFGSNAINIEIAGDSTINTFGIIISGNMFEMTINHDYNEAAISASKAMCMIISDNIFRGALSVTTHGDCITLVDCEYVNIMNNHYYAIKASGVVMNNSFNVRVMNDSFEGILNYIIQGTNCGRYRFEHVVYETVSPLPSSGISCTGSVGYNFILMCTVPAIADDGTYTTIESAHDNSPERNTVTFTGSPTVNTNEAQRFYGKIVNINLDFLTDTTYANGATIATVPTGYAPSKDSFYTVIDGANAPHTLYVTTAGDIKTNGAINSGVRIFANMTFIRH